MEEEANIETVWSGRFIDTVIRDGWEYVIRKGMSGVVGIIPVTDDGEVILVEQYRIPVDAVVVEFPAGLAGDIAGDEDEPLEQAAARELLEETGYEAARMEKVFSGVTSAGVTDEVVTFYLATGLVRKGPGGGDAGEKITVHKVKIESLAEWLSKCESLGKLIDLKVYSALYLWPGLNR